MNNNAGCYICYDAQSQYKNKKNKKVDFSIFRDIIIIPKLSEVCDSIDIWWSNTDKIKAYKSMTTEIENIQRIYPGITVKEAAKILYQPSYVKKL